MNTARLARFHFAVVPDPYNQRRQHRLGCGGERSCDIGEEHFRGGRETNAGRRLIKRRKRDPRLPAFALPNALARQVGWIALLRGHSFGIGLTSNAKAIDMADVVKRLDSLEAQILEAKKGGGA